MLTGLIQSFIEPVEKQKASCKPLFPKHETPNPKPLVPKHETLNPKPLVPKQETLNPEEALQCTYSQHCSSFPACGLERTSVSSCLMTGTWYWV